MNKYMKSAFVIAGILVATGVVIARYIGNAATAAAPSSQPVGATTAPASIGVEELMRNLKKYSGLVVVEGVVAAAKASDQKIALIDTREYRECNDTACAELVLPVRWSGTMPSVKQTVRATGEVKRQDDGKLVFVASDVQVVPDTVEQK